MAARGLRISTLRTDAIGELAPLRMCWPRSPTLAVAFLFAAALVAPGLRDCLALVGLYWIWKYLKRRCGAPRPPESPGTEPEYTEDEWDGWWGEQH